MATPPSDITWLDHGQNASWGWKLSSLHLFFPLAPGLSLAFYEAARRLHHPSQLGCLSSPVISCLILQHSPSQAWWFPPPLPWGFLSIWLLPFVDEHNGSNHCITVQPSRDPADSTSEDFHPVSLWPGFVFPVCLRTAQHSLPLTYCLFMGLFSINFSLFLQCCLCHKNWIHCTQLPFVSYISGSIQWFFFVVLCFTSHPTQGLSLIMHCGVNLLVLRYDEKKSTITLLWC